MCDLGGWDTALTRAAATRPTSTTVITSDGTTHGALGQPIPPQPLPTGPPLPRRWAYPVGGVHIVDQSNRQTALQQALELHEAAGDLRIRRGEDAQLTLLADTLAVLDTANRFLAWLRGTVTIHLVPGPVVDQTTGTPTGTPNGGSPVQIHDNEQFSLTVDTRDAKGFETPDAVTWTVDNDAVAALVVSADTRSCTIVAGSPGSAVVTVTDSDAGLSATEAVDVVAAGTATISLVEGPVEVQP